MSRIIKKYPNRRLYDTGRSRYITLADVRELVVQGVDFTVVDANSGDDLTRAILLQIIVEGESGRRPLFTEAILAQMIRFYDDSMAGAFTGYLEQSLKLFVEQQRHLQQQMEAMMASAPAADALTEMARANMDLWQAMQERFLRAAGVKGGRDRDEDDAPDDPGQP